MVSVDEYKSFVRDKVFPTELQILLEKCKEGNDITEWRKSVWASLMSKTVAGEKM
jgi:hypothetical protein